MKDTYLHKGLRRQLIEEVRRKGIQDENVLKAMEELPRHFFLDNAFAEKAYEDQALPIGNEQTISQPYTVAFMTEALQIKKRDKVLEIGTGSGYQAAILSLLGARVFTVERQEALFHKTKALLKSLGFGMVRIFLRDGHKGLPEFAPFDKIIVTAGASDIPDALLNQLKTGGQLIIPVGIDNQEMIRVTKVSASEYQQERLGAFRFVPFLTGIKSEKR